MRYLEENNENVNNLLLHQLQNSQSKGRIIYESLEGISKEMAMACLMV